MKTLIKLLKPLSFAPALIMMYVIYSFSAQSGEVSGDLSYKISYQIVESKNELMNTNLSYDALTSEAYRIQIYVRKAAHMTEYFMLALAISFPLYVYGVRGIFLLLLAGVFCVAFAASDEFHQGFVEGRGPSAMDVLIDSCGAALGILVVQVFCWSVLRNPSARRKKKKKH
ncbi:MAG: VanZ family protein [Eubacteriales bacterium]|nr:VanZ family protein [Eubacteriales bacterium]